MRSSDAVQKSWLAVSAVCAGLCLGLAAPARAYLDPGSGSYFLQIVAAAVLAAVFCLKGLWRKARSIARAGTSEAGGKDGPDGPGR